MIVITGSRIPRSDLNAVSPVTTVDGYEFKLQGTTNSEELLNWLPQVNPSQGEFVTPLQAGRPPSRAITRRSRCTTNADCGASSG